MNEIMIRVPRDDSCPNCKNDRCIEMYDNKNKPIHYTLLLDKLETNSTGKENISNIEISKCKCTRCGTQYKIDWSNSHKIPRPFFLDELSKLMLDNLFNKLP